jgi:4-hydroxysphinganine ceramide fatty acyl 2-hydroxylase
LRVLLGDRGGDFELFLLWIMQSATHQSSFTAYKMEQSRISRRRLYPVTAFYSLFSVAVWILVCRSRHAMVGIPFYLLGIAVWTLLEYLFHRYILHGRFAPGEGFVRHFLHERLDPLHWEHHKHPFNGAHISGKLSDFLPLFVLAAPMSFVFPVYTMPILLVGTIQGYLAEQWLHHSIHFCSFKNGYFRAMKRYHLYHHSPRGIDRGFGLSNWFWDIVFRTQFPPPVEDALFRRKNATQAGR